MPTLNQEIIDEINQHAVKIKNIPNVQMVAISLGYTLVELDNQIMGVCFTPRSNSGSCAHYHKAGSLSKKNILELAELMLSLNPLERSVGIAAVNAISHTIMDQESERYKFAEKDFLDIIPFNNQKVKIGMVGNIGPFIPILLKNASSLIVVDDNPAFPSGFHQNGYMISKHIDDLADAEILIITGSAAAVGDFDNVIDSAKNARFIGVVGPSAGWLPEPAFRRGVNAVAATRIVDIASARSAILEGGGTPHFINYGRKYTLINEQL